ERSRRADPPTPVARRPPAPRHRASPPAPPAVGDHRRVRGLCRHLETGVAFAGHCAPRGTWSSQLSWSLPTGHGVRGCVINSIVVTDGVFLVVTGHGIFEPWRASGRKTCRTVSFVKERRTLMIRHGRLLVVAVTVGIAVVTIATASSATTEG